MPNLLSEIEQAYFTNELFEGCRVLSMDIAVHPDTTYSIKFLLMNSKFEAFDDIASRMNDDKTIYAVRVEGVDKKCISVGINAFGKRLDLHRVK